MLSFQPYSSLGSSAAANQSTFGSPRGCCAATNRWVPEVRPHGAGEGAANGRDELGGRSDVGTAAAWLEESESVICMHGRTGRGFCPAVYWYLLRVAAGGVAWCLGVCYPRSLWFDSIAACSCPPRPLLSEEEEEGMEKQLCWDTPCTAPCACACFDHSGCFSLLLPPSTRNPHRVKPRELFDPSENCHPAPSSG